MPGERCLLREHIYGNYRKEYPKTLLACEVPCRIKTLIGALEDMAYEISNEEADPLKLFAYLEISEKYFDILKEEIKEFISTHEDI